MYALILKSIFAVHTALRNYWKFLDNDNENTNTVDDDMIHANEKADQGGSTWIQGFSCLTHALLVDSSSNDTSIWFRT